MFTSSPFHDTAKEHNTNLECSKYEIDLEAIKTNDVDSNIMNSKTKHLISIEPTLQTKSGGKKNAVIDLFPT